MPRKYSHRDLRGSINVRLAAQDMENLRAISTRLDLQTSEIARRAIREGLKTFAAAKLPGSIATAQ